MFIKRLRIENLLSIPKSLYVSLHYFKFKDAIKLPIFVRYNCCIKAIKGKIIVHSPIKFKMLSIGFEDVNTIDKKYQRCIFRNYGLISLSGSAHFGPGSKINVEEKATLHLGNRFWNTGGVMIECHKKIEIGDNALISWDTLIMDTDFHHTIDTISNHISEKEKPIHIGEHVWICCRATILKGSNIGDNNIVAANSLVIGRYNEVNCLIAGNPASIKKKNITLHH